MANVSLQDFLNTQDLTNVNPVTGAQLNQILTSGTPYGDKGMIMTTTDTIVTAPGGRQAAIPNVPDPTQGGAYTKWEFYLWRQLTPQYLGGGNTVTLWYWSPYAAGPTGFINWQPLFSGSIAAGSITGTMIALATSGSGITDANIVNISASKIVGSVPIAGAAGGMLSGTYPNPNIGANVITSANITTSDAVGITDANIQSISSGAGINPVGATGKIAKIAASNLLIMNAGATAWTAMLDYFALLIQTYGLTTAGSIPQVNAGATALSWLALGTAGQQLQVNAGATALAYFTPFLTTSGYISSTSAPPANASPPFNSFGDYIGGHPVTFAHSLAAVPKYVRVVLACTSNDTTSKYLAGDEIDIATSLYADNTNGTAPATTWNPIILNIFCNVTNVVVSGATNQNGAAAALTVKLVCRDQSGIVAPSSWNNFCVKCYASI